MNRIQAAIDRRAAQLMTAEEGALLKVAAHCEDTSHEELAACQTLKSLAQASGVITLDEALTLFAIFGGETASVEQWRQRTLAEKITALEMVFEIHQKMHS